MAFLGKKVEEKETGKKVFDEKPKHHVISWPLCGRSCKRECKK